MCISILKSKISSRLVLFFVVVWPFLPWHPLRWSSRWRTWNWQRTAYFWRWGIWRRPFEKRLVSWRTLTTTATVTMRWMRLWTIVGSCRWLKCCSHLPGFGYCCRLCWPERIGWSWPVWDWMWWASLMWLWDWTCRDLVAVRCTLPRLSSCGWVVKLGIKLVTRHTNCPINYIIMT